jgi:hypothetical protein
VIRFHVVRVRIDGRVLGWNDSVVALYLMHLVDVLSRAEIVKDGEPVSLSELDLVGLGPLFAASSGAQGVFAGTLDGHLFGRAAREAKTS